MTVLGSRYTLGANAGGGPYSMDLSRFAFKRERGEADPVAPKRLRREIAAPPRDAGDAV